MGEIAVHFEDELVFPREGPGKARAVGASQAVLGGAVEHADGVVVRSELVRDLASAVGELSSTISRSTGVDSDMIRAASARMFSCSL